MSRMRRKRTAACTLPVTEMDQVNFDDYSSGHSPMELQIYDNVRSIASNFKSDPSLKPVWNQNYGFLFESDLPYDLYPSPSPGTSGTFTLGNQKAIQVDCDNFCPSKTENL